MTAAELDEAFFRLFRLRGVLDPTGAVPGLGASGSELMTLSRLRDGAVPQHELGTYLGLEKSTVSRLVDGMVAKGWVERDRDPANRRFATVRLTTEGLSTARAVGRAMHRRHSAILEGLSSRDAATMIKGLTILLTALERELEAAQPAP